MDSKHMFEVHLSFWVACRRNPQLGAMSLWIMVNPHDTVNPRPDYKMKRGEVAEVRLRQCLARRVQVRSGASRQRGAKAREDRRSKTRSRRSNAGRRMSGDWGGRLGVRTG